LEIPEDELILKSREGDRDAFRQIVQIHQEFAYAVAYRFLGNATDAEDAVQESFLKVWTHLGDFDPSKKFSTWLYRIVTNACLDHVKSSKRRRAVMVSSSEVDRAVSGSGPDTAFEEKEAVRMIHRFVRELPVKQRMVFILRDLQDLSVEETARVLKSSQASVKSNLCHARKFIRERVGGVL
jgi:RNA polymerase sigma-70 factor (ECF subfamily)